MAEDMIERVARILEPQAWAAFGFGDTLAYKNRRTSSLRKARAAIAAMREPTMEMVEVGYTEINNNIDSWSFDSDAGYCVGDIAPTATWRAMIDAALSPQARKEID